MSDRKGGLGSAIAGVVWSVAAAAIFGSPPIAVHNDQTEQPPLRKKKRLVSPGIPLCVELDRTKQFSRDYAWYAYCRELIDDGQQTQSDVIIRKLREFQEQENPAIEIEVEGYPAKEYDPEEYVPPPPPPPKAGCNPADSSCQFSADSTNWCLLWHQCMRDDRLPERITVFTDEDLKRMTADEDELNFESPVVSSLVAMLNELTEKDVLTWALRANDNRKQYPDGWSWQIIEYLPELGTPHTKVTRTDRTGQIRNTVTRYMTTTSATQFVIQALRSLNDEAVHATDGEQPEATERNPAP